MVAAAVYRAGHIVSADGEYFEAADFNRWAEKPPITLEEAMRKWK